MDSSNNRKINLTTKQELEIKVNKENYWRSSRENTSHHPETGKTQRQAQLSQWAPTPWKHRHTKRNSKLLTVSPTCWELPQLTNCHMIQSRCTQGITRQHTYVWQKAGRIKPALKHHRTIFNHLQNIQNRLSHVTFQQESVWNHTPHASRRCSHRMVSPQEKTHKQLQINKKWNWGKCRNLKTHYEQQGNSRQIPCESKNNS